MGRLRLEPRSRHCPSAVTPERLRLWTTKPGGSHRAARMEPRASGSGVATGTRRDEISVEKSGARPSFGATAQVPDRTLDQLLGACG
jgi:hypothetical protein